MAKLICVGLILVNVFRLSTAVSLQDTSKNTVASNESIATHLGQVNTTFFGLGNISDGMGYENQNATEMISIAANDLYILEHLPDSLQELLKTPNLIAKLNNLNFALSNPVQRKFADRLMKNPKFATFILQSIEPSFGKWAVEFVQRQRVPQGHDHSLEVQTLISHSYTVVSMSKPFDPFNLPATTFFFSKNLGADTMVTYALHTLVRTMMSGFVMLFCLSALYQYLLREHGTLTTVDTALVVFVGFLFIRPAIFGIV